ncbi:MAG: hypothetical protein AAGH83_07455 [Pseudomonadota bacterium]
MPGGQSTYAARLVTSLPVWEMGAMRLKPYWVDREDDAEPPAALLEAARAQTETVLPPEAEAEGDHAGLGFVVLHRGAEGTWLLMDWWARGDTCCQRVAKAPRGSTAFELVGPRPLMACVWELALVWREREAWVETMMSGRPNPAEYLRRRVADGWY